MINQAYIFVPMLVVVALTFVAFIGMSVGRAGAIKAGHDPAYYKAHLGAPEPEGTVVKVRHYNNMFEMPVLFYAACLTAFVLGAVGTWTVYFAWGYVIMRLIQSVVHLAHNNAVQRGMAFSLSVLFMLALWINIGMSVAGKL